jgi:pimeloyl-ACP methyl ester carboxylesterase
VSRAARYWSSWTTSAVLVAVLVGCSGSGDHAPAVEGPYGSGRAQAWVVPAEGKPKAVVAVLHGLAPDPGLAFQPWLVHLAERGYDVIFPRYEAVRGEPRARDGVIDGVRNGLGHLGHPTVPLVLVGHSRGGRLAVEAAPFLKAREAIAIFPGRINPSYEPQTDFTKLPRTTAIWLLVGQDDHDVGAAGAVELFERLRTMGVPRAQIHGGRIRSTRGFRADHLSVYRTGPGARRAIWGRVDRLIRQAVGA